MEVAIIKVKTFIPNKNDNLHCFQSCFQMAYETLLTQRLSSLEVDKLTNFVEGSPTWPFAGMLSFMEAGLNITYIENFPFELFINDPIEAIKRQFTDESVSNHIISVSDFDTEVIFAKKCFEHPQMTFEERIPNLSDIKHVLLNESLIIANVNYWALLGEEKYAGHFVILEEELESGFLLQNPGLPPINNQTVTEKLFLSAWNYPDNNAANILSVSKS